MPLSDRLAEFDTTTKVLTFKTDKFSTYALVYNDTIIEEPEDEDIKKEEPKEEDPITENPKTGDNIRVFAGIMIIALVGLIITIKIKRTKEQ